MTSKTAISLDAELLKKMEYLANKHNLSRSAVFAEAAHEYIVRHENQILFDALNDTYSQKPDKEEQKLSRRRKQGHRRLVEGEW